MASVDATNVVPAQPTASDSINIPDVGQRLEGGAYGKTVPTGAVEKSVQFFRGVKEATIAANAAVGTLLFSMVLNLVHDDTFNARKADYMYARYLQLLIEGKREDVVWMRNAAVWLTYVNNAYVDVTQATPAELAAYCERDPKAKRFGMSELLNLNLVDFFDDFVKQSKIHVNPSTGMPKNYTRCGTVMIVLAKSSIAVPYQTTIAYSGSVEFSGFIKKSMLADAAKKELEIPSDAQWNLHQVEVGVTDARTVIPDPYPFDYEGTFYPHDPVELDQFATSSDDAITWKENFALLSQHGKAYHSAKLGKTTIVFGTNQAQRQTFSEPVFATQPTISSGFVLVREDSTKGQHHNIDFAAIADVKQPAPINKGDWPADVYDGMVNAGVAKPKRANYEADFLRSLRNVVSPRADATAEELTITDVNKFYPDPKTKA